MIKNIIFDLGGVLIDWNPKFMYRKIFDSESEIDWFLTNICTMEWNVQQDAGRTLEEATSVLQSKHPEWSDKIAAYYGRWDEMLNGPIEKTLDLFELIRANNKHNIYGLTNWSAETFPVALDRYDFLHSFDGIVVSGDEKCIKPDAKIYNILLDRYNLIPQECLFIDDNKHNIAGALSLGIQAIWFQSPEQLQIDLKELEIV